MSQQADVEVTHHTGQAKQAAARTGCTVEEWRGRRAAGMNWCVDCRAWRPASLFSTDRSRFSGLQQYCKPCAKVRTVACRYKVTKEEARLLIAANTCAICGRSGVKFEVDHNHKTGRVRGVLCSRCNGALGQFLDDVGLLKKAIAYLGEQDG